MSIETEKKEDYTIGLFVKSKTQGLGINDDDDDDDGFEHTIV